MSVEVELSGALNPEYGDALSEREHRYIADLIEVWDDRYGKNQKRARYYEGKNKLHDLGISIPPMLKTVETVVGWPKKAVDMLANRVIFNGFVSTDDEVGELLRAACEDNDLRQVHHMACISQLEFGCCAMTVSAGDGIEEPDVVVNVYDALTCSMLWNWRLKRVACGLTIVDAEYDEAASVLKPTHVNLWTDDSIVEIRKRQVSGLWEVNRIPHMVGRPLLEPLVYRPSLTRPFGESRINRTVMSITDSAVRTALRTEIASEFYTAPQRYLLGADVDTFGDPETTSEGQRNAEKLKQYLGTMLAISPNENGDIPQYGQLPQMTMQPHSDYMRTLATRFAGETGLPVHSLGVITDNPASAEALYSATDELIQEAERVCESNKNTLRTVGLLALAVQSDETFRSVKSMGLDINADFRNPARVSVAARTDAIMKQVAQFPWMAESDVVLRELGYSDEEIRLLTADRERWNAEQERLAAQEQALGTPQTGSTNPQVNEAL